MKSASCSVARPRSSVRICPALGRRTAPGRLLDLGDGAVELVDGERRLVRRRLLDPVDRRVPDADPALTRAAGQETDGERHLARIERLQELREDCNLLRARARLGDRARGGDDDGE